MSVNNQELKVKTFRVEGSSPHQGNWTDVSSMERNVSNETAKE